MCARASAGHVRAILVAAVVVPLAISGAALVFWRGFWGPPVVVVTNESGALVRGLLLDGDGSPWSQRLPDLMPGETITTIVHPPSDSGLRISFVLNDRTMTSGDLAYIEARGDFGASVTIHKDGAVDRCANNGFCWARALR